MSSSSRLSRPLRAYGALAGALALMACACPYPGLALGDWRGDLVLHEFAIPKGGFILVRLKVAGRPAVAVIDTGSTYSVYDRRMRALLGAEREEIEVETPLGIIRQRQFDAPPIAVGKARLRHRRGTVACDDLENMRLASGQRFDMVLGMDVLESTIIQLDFKAGRGAFLRDYDGALEPATPLRWGGGTLWTIASGAGFRATWFRIDTGFVFHGFGSLDAALFTALQRKSLLRRVAARGTAAGNLSARDDVRVVNARYAERIRIGDHEYRGAEFLMAHGNTLGLGFLSQHVATIDCQKKRLYLRRIADPTNVRFGATIDSGIEVMRK